MVFVSPRHLILLLCIATTSCSKPSSQDTPDSEMQTRTVLLRQEALRAITDRVIITQYAEFVTHSKALVSTTSAWKDAPQSSAQRAAAQQAWRDAMSTWQHAEVAQIGPAGLMKDVAGGEDLRNLIYSWPLTNACRVDQELAKAGFEAPEFFAQQLVNVRGLDALEYVLFHEGKDNACAPNATLNAGETWSSLAAEELTARRARFAHAAAKDLAEQAVALHQAWREDGKNFRAELINAGTSSSTYGSTQEALNALSDAMFYIEKETKDMKLAIPAGISQCNAMICPEALEHPYANFSLEASRANHEAFQALYLGHMPDQPEAKGFDDLLIELGQEELDAQIKTLLNEALAAHDAIDKPLSEALVDELPKVIALHSASQELGLVLKTQFISVLDLELPQRAEGDND